MSGNRQRFWPSLYDRLCTGAVEGKDDNFITSTQLRQSVQRDLENLFNAISLSSYVDLERFPNVRMSVLNYGLPDMTGKFVSGFEPWKMRKIVTDALRTYEPRITEDDVSIDLDTSASASASQRVDFDVEKGLNFIISGKVLGTPEEYVRIRTHWNPETHTARIEVE